MRKNNDKDIKIKMTKIRRVDEHNKFALNFFWRYGKDFFKSIEYNSKSNEIKILRVGFVGFGDYAYELLKVLCCLGQLPKCRLIVYIFDKNAEEKKELIQNELLENCANNVKNEPIASGLNALYKGTRRIIETSKDKLADIKYLDEPFYEIHFINCDVTTNSFSENCFIRAKEENADANAKKSISFVPFTHMFFMTGSDETNINVATNVSVVYKRHNADFLRDSNYNYPQFYVMVKNDSTTAQLKTSSDFYSTYRYLIFIGSISERYSLDSLENTELDSMALNIHRMFKFNQCYYDFQHLDKPHSDNTKGETEASKKQKDEITSKIFGNAISILSKDIKEHSAEYVIKYEYKKILTDSIFDKTKTENMTPKDIQDLQVKILTVLKPFLPIYDTDAIEEYNKKEANIRSSKARALFEKMLLTLNYLKFDENGKLIYNNVVAEFGVSEEEWENFKNAFIHKENSEYYKKRETDFNRVRDAFAAASTVDAGNILDIDIQKFEVDNILQKRWMVFRWSEGYIRNDNQNQTTNGIDRAAKRQQYLMPYLDIFINPEKRQKHTIDTPIKVPTDSTEKIDEKQNAKRHGPRKIISYLKCLFKSHKK
ncbi:MAG: hypothetical protein NC311_16170 [Muribaculaceae bacterium]|nr:hypothetical protein [Muribaculaceae bacterium]MCM1440777.1 hypothetical protein [Roseburia sp.]